MLVIIVGRSLSLPNARVQLAADYIKAREASAILQAHQTIARAARFHEPLVSCSDSLDGGSVISMGACPKRPDSERPDYHCGNSGHPEWHVDSCHAHWPPEKESQQLDAGQQRKEEAGDQSVSAHRSSLYEVCRPPNARVQLQPNQ
jgi:hypothetical protein